MNKVETIRNAVYRAVAIRGGPVKYDNIVREARDISPETITRYLRDENFRKTAGIIKVAEGIYTITKLKNVGSLGRFV